MKRALRDGVGRVSARVLLLSAVLLAGGFQIRAATFWVYNTQDEGAGSLRQALVDANGLPGLDTIQFQIAGTGVHTLTPANPLPAITDPVVLDGTTQPGYAGRPLIELNGANAGNNAGLRLLAGGSAVRGLIINRFGGSGIQVEGPGTNCIQANFIGTDSTGTVSLGNGIEGVWLYDASGNEVGGTNSGEGNVISGNQDAGVYVMYGAGNLIVGNFIGTSGSGDTARGNGNNGVMLYNAPGNWVGGPTVNARNTISGNGGSGIYVSGPSATGNVICGNYIGTTGSGSLGLGNEGDGVTVEDASNNTIGGTNSGTGNLISGNSQGGVFLADSEYNLVVGNLIGTDATGQSGLGNGYAGVTLSNSTSNRVGSAEAGARNVISGNRKDGVFILSGSMGNRVEGNYIGTDTGGSLAVANRFNGVTLQECSKNTIGAMGAGRNVISGNGAYGIDLLSGATDNSVAGNLVGSDLTGQKPLGNHYSGVRVGATGNLIARGNLLSGNADYGLVLTGASAGENVVEGNMIGTSANGAGALGNGSAGVGLVGAPNNRIGGSAAGVGNLISANADAGIYIVGPGASGNEISGNKIGTDPAGVSSLGNAMEGIYIQGACSNKIGADFAAAGNVISGNGTRGIFLTNASWTAIRGNLIGTKADGFSALPNTFHNVECEAGTTNVILGGSASAGNRIAFAPGVYAGVRIRPGSFNNSILGNSIFSNGGLGVDIGSAGVAANPPCNDNLDTTPQQNFPLLTQAVCGNGTRVRGTLNSRPNTSFLLQFFANAICDSSGNGEGELYLGDWSVVTGPDCTTSFVANLPVAIPEGYVVSATATDPANNTSEFSGCVPVGSMPCLVFGVSGKAARISWRNSMGGLLLRQTASLNPPIRWAAVTNAPVISAGECVVSLPLCASNCFYALSFE